MNRQNEQRSEQCGRHYALSEHQGMEKGECLDESHHDAIKQRHCQHILCENRRTECVNGGYAVAHIILPGHVKAQNCVTACAKAGA